MPSILQLSDPEEECSFGVGTAFEKTGGAGNFAPLCSEGREGSEIRGEADAAAPEEVDG